MASRYATRPGRPSINSSSRHNARSQGIDGSYYRNRYAGDEEAEDEDSSAVSSFPLWKTVGVMAIVFACFAAVYPKMFHPMILYAFGSGQSQHSDDNNVFAHPSMKHGPNPGSSRQPFAQDGRHASGRSGPGPMPGMGAGMHPSGEGGGRGSKSMWHWMLPFYTIGVIVFLLYTLSKILWKKPKKGNSRRQTNWRYDATTDRSQTNDANSDGDVDEEEEEEENGGDDGEDDAAVMSNKQLHSLQRHLKDTELAMHEILSQLEQLSATADPVAAEEIKKMTLETLSGLGKLSGKRPASARKPRFSEFDDDGSQFDPSQKRYLKDLQKALSDFKQFTENYIEEHSQKHQQQDQVEGEVMTNAEQEIGQAGGTAEDPPQVDQLGEDGGLSTSVAGEAQESEDDGKVQHVGADAKETNVHEENVAEPSLEFGCAEVAEKKETKQPVRQRKGRKHARHEE